MMEIFFLKYNKNNNDYILKLLLLTLLLKNISFHPGKTQIV
jgi:hypothetical protein